MFTSTPRNSISTSSNSVGNGSGGPMNSASKRLLHELHLYSTANSQTNHPPHPPPSSSPHPTQPEISNNHNKPYDISQDKDKTSSDESDIYQQLGPVSDAELFHWTAILQGPKGSVYEEGKWKMEIRVPGNYPLAPPLVRFVTSICHPNVNFKVCYFLSSFRFFSILASLVSLAFMVLLSRPELVLFLGCMTLFERK